MYELYQNSQQYSHTLTGHFPLSRPEIRMCAASWCARFWLCSVSRLKEIPENYSESISLEYYRVALGRYRRRFHPVNDLAPYMNQARGASLKVQCKGNSSTPDHIRYYLIHSHAATLSTIQHLFSHAGMLRDMLGVRLYRSLASSITLTCYDFLGNHMSSCATDDKDVLDTRSGRLW